MLLKVSLTHCYHSAIIIIVISSSVQMASPIHDQDGIARTVTDTPPTHYAVKIQSFSLLKEKSVQTYDSGDFEAGGYKWKLILHPKGNKNRNVNDHISLYLAMADTSSLKSGWEVYADFRLFLLDQNKDVYLTLQDTLGNGKRFHGMNPEWGFDKFISLKSFNDASNGYLINDDCVFGAEVFVRKERISGKGECLSMIADPVSYKHSWKIENFWSSDTTCFNSSDFNAGDMKWKMMLYPKGIGSGSGSHVSVFLTLVEPKSPSPSTKILVEFTVRVLDKINGRNLSGKATRWFTASKIDQGWTRYSPVSYYILPNLGYVMKDTCWLEAEVSILGVATEL